MGISCLHLCSSAAYGSCLLLSNTLCQPVLVQKQHPQKVTLASTSDADAGIINLSTQNNFFFFLVW